MALTAWRLLAAATLSLALIAPAWAQDQAQPADAESAEAPEDLVLARVNGEEVRQSHVLELAANLPPQYQLQLAQILPLLVERVIDLKLLAKAAEHAGMGNDPEVTQRMDAIRQSVMREIYLTRQIEDATTEAALNEEYEAWLVANPPQPEIRASHILVADKAAAETVIQELEGGADFAALAEEKSTDPGTAPNGGDLGYFTSERMVPRFSEAAFELEVGSFSSEPVETEFGWHVIKVVDRRESEPPVRDDIEGELRESIERKVVQGLLTDLRADAEIEMLNIEPAGEPAPGAAEPAAEEEPTEGEAAEPKKE